MEAGVPHYFSVNMNEMVLQITLLGLLRSFKDNSIENFEIEVYGYTIDKQKKFWRFKNHHGPWDITQEEMKKFMDFNAVLEEHGNTTTYFGVIYQKPVKVDYVDITVSVVPQLEDKKDVE